METRLSRVTTHLPWLVSQCDHTGQLLGYAYADQFNPRAAYRWTVETSVYVRQNCQGRGGSGILDYYSEHDLLHYLNKNKALNKGNKEKGSPTLHCTI